MSSAKLLIFFLILVVSCESYKKFFNESSPKVCDSLNKLKFSETESAKTKLSHETILKVGGKLFKNDFLRSFIRVNASENCVRDVKVLLSSMKNFELWALKSEKWKSSSLNDFQVFKNFSGRCFRKADEWNSKWQH